MSPSCGADDFPRFSVLDVHLTATRLERAVDRVIEYARDAAGRRYVCVFAVDSVLKSHDNPRLAEIANASAMTLCDGMPLVFLGRKFAKADMSRCYGPDVMLGVTDRGRAAGLRHFYYGGADERTVELLQKNLEEKFPGVNIVGHYVPPFRPLTAEEKADVIKRIDESGADVVWVGIGTPKQDEWASEMRPLLKAPVLVAVGAAFNFHAGTVSQAPLWMRRSGLEWFYRLCAEPRRLWKRYIIGNPRFVFLVLKQLITGKPAPLGSACPEK